MLNGADRGDALYAAVSSGPNFDMLSQGEKDQVRTQLQAIFSADTSYLTANATVLPGGMTAPAGASVTTSTGAGSVTSPVRILGSGRLS